MSSETESSEVAMVGNQRQWQWCLLSWQPLEFNWSITHREVISCLALWFLWNSDTEDKLSSMKPLPTSDGLVPVHTAACEHRLISEQQLFQLQHIRSFNTEKSPQKIVILWNSHKKWLWIFFCHRNYSSPFIYLVFFSISVLYTTQWEANKKWVSTSLLGNLI